MPSPVAPWAEADGFPGSNSPAEGSKSADTMLASRTRSIDEGFSTIPAFLQAGTAPEPLQPCSVEGDRSGVAYTADGHLLIGGLAVDGSSTGEGGWATLEPLKGSSRGAPTFSSPTRTSQHTRGPRGPSLSRASHNASDFEPCAPADGSSTFGIHSGGTARDGGAGALGGSVVATSWTRNLKGRSKSVSSNSHTGDALVNLSDIIGGRTCRPISLSDLRIYLAKQRDIEEEDASMGIVETASLQLQDLVVHSNPSTTSIEYLRSPFSPAEDSGKDKNVAIIFVEPNTQRHSQAAGECMALEFIVAFDRYTRYWRTLTPQQKQVISNPSASGPIHPLRERFVRLVERHVGPVPGLASSTTLGRSRSTSVATKKTVVAILPPLSPRPRASCRLQWMIELGLLDGRIVSEALHESALLSDPDVLLPLVNSVVGHIDTYVIPGFLEAASRNLGKGTSHGRLYSGLALTAIAFVLSVLLIITPSPLTGTRISRWYRLLTFPLWAFGMGFVLAAYTGVCMWLSLTGTRDVTGEGQDAETTSDIETVDEAPTHSTDTSQWMVAPEIWKLLGYVVPRKVLETIGNGRGSVTDVEAGRWQVSKSSNQQLMSVADGSGDPSKLTTQVKQLRKPLTPVDEKSEQLGVIAATTTATPLSTSPPPNDTSAIVPTPARTDKAESGPTFASSSSATVAATAPPPPSSQTIRDGSPRIVSKSISLAPGVEIGLRKVISNSSLKGSIGAQSGTSSPNRRASASLAPSSDSITGGRPRAHSGAALLPPSASVSISPPEERGKEGQMYVPFKADSDLEATKATRTAAAAAAAAAGLPQRGSDLDPPQIGQVSFSPPKARLSPLQQHRRRRTTTFSRAWAGTRTLIGMSVNTERVRDERIRRIHLWRAAKALIIDGGLSALVMIIVVAIP